MQVVNKPTNLATLRTFQDKKGNQYELRGQQNMYSAQDCFKTNYYELYKKGKKDNNFGKVGAKEEVYLDSYYGYRPSTINKERFVDGKMTESAKVTKVLNGYDIECKGDALSMKGPLRVLHAKDIYGDPVTKIKLPDALEINGQKSLTPMAKRVMKLLKHV